MLPFILNYSFCILPNNVSSVLAVMRDEVCSTCPVFLFEIYFGNEVQRKYVSVFCLGYSELLVGAACSGVKMG